MPLSSTWENGDLWAVLWEQPVAHSPVPWEMASVNPLGPWAVGTWGLLACLHFSFLRQHLREPLNQQTSTDEPRLRVAPFSSPLFAVGLGCPQALSWGSMKTQMGVQPQGLPVRWGRQVPKRTSKEQTDLCHDGVRWVCYRGTEVRWLQVRGL